MHRPVLPPQPLAGVLDPVDRLAAVVDADDVGPAVAIAVQGQGRGVVEPPPTHVYIADLVPLPGRRFVPPAAAEDVEGAVAIDIERCARGKLAPRIKRVPLPGYFLACRQGRSQRDQQ